MITIERQILIKSASYAACSIAVVILVIKAHAWFLTESQSILASVIDSMLDLSSSFINLIALRFALKPPDHHHRFGHEKIQDLTIFSQAIFFCISGVLTCISSIKSLLAKSVPTNLDYGIQVMYICIILTIILLLYQTYVIRKTGAEITKVDKLHYFTDLITNFSIVISINLSSKFWFVDGLSGIGISLYIIYASYGLFRKAFKNLVDEEFLEEDRKKILETIGKFTEVKGVHEMKTRYAADKPFIQCHIEMDGSMSLHNSHYISDQISNALLSEFSGAEIIIHLDPHGYEEEVSYRENIRD